MLKWRQNHQFTKNGASGQDWTADTRIFSPVLYQLSYRGKMAVQTGLEPAISSVTDWHVNQLHYWTINIGCGSRIWTYDLRVMSPTSYQTALSRDNGGERGIRTPAGLSSPVGFQDRSLQPGLGISPYCDKYIKLMVDPAGLEPATDRLWAGGSNQLSYGSKSW